MISLSLPDARRLALASQGLHVKTPFGAGKNAVLRCIEQLGYVQIDTISVINRSHHHCIWTRVPSYQPAHLDRLLKDRQVLEYWSHAAAFLPMADYRYCLPYMQAIAAGKKHWRTPDRKAMQRVLDRIRAEGPLMARDFEHAGDRGNEWGWNWKPAKIALEQLFIEGQLMASHREGFQKVYDLPERVLPPGIDTRTPSGEEFQRYLITRAIRAHGLVRDGEISYLRKGMKAGVKARLQDMLDAGEIVGVTVRGIEGPYYSHQDLLASLPGKRVNRQVNLLSPFDNAVIQRKRLQQLFGSHYQIECFVPAAKRRYGYYCLPIQYGTDIVGRLDPKADRKSGAFIVKSLHLEQAVRDPDHLAGKLAEKLREVAAFNGCDRIAWRPGRRDAFGRLLQEHLAG